MTAGFQFIDAAVNNKTLISTPQRIICLVPSLTEYLIDIGANVVGRTKFCIHPADEVHNIPTVGGTKKFDFGKIAALNPDFIVTNKEENYEAGVLALAQQYPTWMSDIITLQDAWRDMLELARLVGKPHEGERLVNAGMQSFANIQVNTSGDLARPRVLYLIWKDPFMAAGSQTFINEMLKVGGFNNVVSDQARYPELSAEAIATLQPQHVFLSSEPYPFQEKHIRELQDFLPDAKIHLVDGELFSWYGSRLLQTPDYLTHLQAKLA